MDYSYSLEWNWAIRLPQIVVSLCAYRPFCWQDLEEVVNEVLANPDASDSGMAPVYGMNAKMPDRSIVGDFLTAYQDALLSV